MSNQYKILHTNSNLYEMNKWSVISNGDGLKCKTKKKGNAQDACADDNDNDDDDMKKKPPPSSSIESKLKGKCFISTS